MALSPVFVPLTEAVALAVNVAPSTMVRVEPVAGCVIVILFTLVAVATPMVGVTSVGLVASALAPEPVEVVTPVPPDKTASVAESPAAVPVLFWFKVGKVQLAKFPEVGVPSIGVISVGLVSTTNFEPVPVWLAITVALPVLVITPVRLAFVVTVALFPVIDPLGTT